MDTGIRSFGYFKDAATWVAVGFSFSTPSTIQETFMCALLKGIHWQISVDGVFFRVITVVHTWKEQPLLCARKIARSIVLWLSRTRNHVFYQTEIEKKKVCFVPRNGSDNMNLTCGCFK